MFSLTEPILIFVPGQMSAVGGGYLQFGDDGRLLQASSGQFIQPPEQVDPVTQLPIPGTGGPPILQPSPVNPETGLLKSLLTLEQMLHW